MSTTSVTITDGGETTVATDNNGATTVSSVDGSTTIVEHGTINQPYIGPTIYVQTSAPVSPVTGSIWYDTTP